MGRHAASYYAASAGALSRYPALKGTRRADVAVIGAGFTGLAAALSLAERGYGVVLLEAARVGWGASGRNGGHLIDGFASNRAVAAKLGGALADFFWQLRWAGHALVREWVARHHIDCELKFGYLDVAETPRQMRALAAAQEEWVRHHAPYDSRLLSAGEVEALIASRAFIGGRLNGGNGHLHPLKLALGEARAAARLGVAIHEESPVIALEPGPRCRLRTAQGEVIADHVVLAGGVYQRLAKGVRRATFHAGSFIMASAPLAAAVVERINPRDLAVCDQNLLPTYWRLSADKRLIFGGRCNYSGATPANIAAVLRPRLARLYPELGAVPADYEWGGTLGVTWRRAPLIGRLAPNVYYAQGYAGHGVNVAHLAGNLIAQAIMGAAEHFDLLARPRPPNPLLSHPLGNRLLALAMLAYRLWSGPLSAALEAVIKAR
ncbi:MAG: NAD(P)/FAD-dependent oxidoreductase [Pseudomonadota bacterium]